MLNYFLGIILVLVLGYFTFMSSVLVSDRKARYRSGTHDYYDNPTEKDNE